MQKLELSNGNNLILIQESNMPNVCGLVKGKDLALSISIKVYKTSKNKIGKLVSSYSNTWFNSCSIKDFKNFILNFFKNIGSRNKYRLSTNEWTEEFILCKEDIYKIDNFIEANKDSIFLPLKKDYIKSISSNSNSKYKNVSLKKEAIDLLVTDEDLEYLSEFIFDKKELVLAICELAKGKTLEDILYEFTKEEVSLA